MQKTDLLVFNKDDVRAILTDLDFKISNKRKEKNKFAEVVVTEDNDPVLCPTCEREIFVNHVGTIAHGSKLIFCDNPFCFATWVANKRIK